MHRLHLLLQRLADAGVDFVVVGGYAGVLHGSALITNDVDVCTVLTSETVGKLRVALADLNPVHRMTPDKLSFLIHPGPDHPVQNLYLRTDGGTIDVLSSILGVGEFERLKERAIEILLFGRKCSVIALDDLIAAKEAVGREKDLLAAKELRAIAAKQAQGR